MKWLKRLAVLVIVALAACYALGVCPFDGGAEKMAAALLTAEKNAAATPTLSKEFKTTDVEFGYKVQNAYVDARLKTEKIAGYKGALTAKPLMEKFGASDPATAVLFESGRFAEGSVITLSRKGIMLEEEVGFRFGKKIDKPLKDAAELKACVSAVFPAIEVPLVAFETLNGVTAFDMIAANVGSWGYIIGTEMPLDNLDLNAVEMKATCNGEAFNAGKGSDALGDQWKALLWIVNNVVKHGRTVEPGQIVISGAMGAMKPAKPGSYAVDFGSLGTISFEVKAQ